MKNAIVTGAAGNLGKAIIRKLLQTNYNVIGTVRTEQAIDEFEDHPNFEKYTLDLNDQKATEAFVHYTANKLHHIHFSALLVGGFGMNKIEDTSLEEIHKMFQLNFETAFISAQQIYKQLLKQTERGKILFIGAKPAVEKGASEGLTAYALSKSLVIKLAEHINTEGAKHNISASVIVPSVIDTPENRDAMPDADFSAWVTPNQIAEASLFIAENASNPIRDITLKVYGQS